MYLVLYHDVFSVGNIGVHNRYPVAIQSGVDLQLLLVALIETGGLFDFSLSISCWFLKFCVFCFYFLKNVVYIFPPFTAFSGWGKVLDNSSPKSFVVINLQACLG